MYTSYTHYIVISEYYNLNSGRDLLSILVLIKMLIGDVLQYVYVVYRATTVNYIKNRTLHNVKGETFFILCALYPYTQKIYIYQKGM